uniref:RPA_interact_N domain-containing protein n=1 Tax=Syphacia muris TaxID=451379 RepID=A0A0N5A972_9BILA
MDSGSSPVAKDFCSKSPFAHLYKRKGANWKAEIRKNVNRRLRDSRNNLIDRFRLMNVQEKQVFLNNVIKEELNKQCDKQISAEELDEAIKEYEEFRQELLQQELDDMLKAEHDFILAEISHYFDSDDVYCPLCQCSGRLKGIGVADGLRGAVVISDAKKEEETNDEQCRNWLKLLF